MIVALVFAFAKPYLSKNENKNLVSEKVIGIYIDNSFSMNGEGTEGKAIESARQKAYSIVDASEPNTKIALLTNELSEKQNRFYSKDEAKQLLAKVNENHHWMPLSNIVLRFKNMSDRLLENKNLSLYLISDFQKRSSDLANLKADSSMVYNFIKVPINTVNNLYIDSCWFDAPTHYSNQLEVLNVKIVNRSDEDYRQIPVNLYINDSLKALAAADVNSNEEATIVLQFSNPKEGLMKGRLEITDYPIVHDNTLYLAYQVKSKLNVLLITDGSTENNAATNLKAVFENDDLVHLETANVDRIQISKLPEYSVIFLNEIKTLSSGLLAEFEKYVTNGGTLVLIPAMKCDLVSYNQLLSTFELNTLVQPDTSEIPIGNVMYDHPLYSQVFKDNADKVALPTMKYRYRFTETSNLPVTQILTFADKTQALTEANIGSGKFYTFSFPLSFEKNEFLKHVLFLPSIYNIALNATSSQQLYHVMGVDRFFEWSNLPQNTVGELLLKHIQSKTEFIPKVLPHAENSFKVEIENAFDAGWYSLNTTDAEIGVAAYNYSHAESDLIFYNNSEIEKTLQQQGIKRYNLIEASNEKFSAAISEIDKGKQFWKLFIVIALLFLAIEAAIIKFWP
jgi:hypothetical protein